MTTTIEKTSTMKWYVVRAQSNRERSVSERLIKEAEKGDLMGKIGRVIVPIEKTSYLKNGKKITKDKVLFPGYIFVETNAIGELKFHLKGLSGATGFLTNRTGEIQALSQKEIEQMLNQKLEVEKEPTEPQYIVGEEVKIIDGPFNGFVAHIDEIKEKKIKLSVLIFGRKTPVDLDILQITKVA
jgi:transcriptional antiterminator NusG